MIHLFILPAVLHQLSTRHIMETLCRSIYSCLWSHWRIVAWLTAKVWSGGQSDWKAMHNCKGVGWIPRPFLHNMRLFGLGGVWTISCSMTWASAWTLLVKYESGMWVEVVQSSFYLSYSELNRTFLVQWRCFFFFFFFVNAANFQDKRRNKAN